MPDQFWAADFTWNDLERASRGYQLRQTREWERTRQHGEWMAAFWGVDLKKELKGRRLLDLSTDPAPAKPKETDTEFLARMASRNYYRPN
ncbi:hypothetical protein [Hymenobacter fodinae]|uniref:hypothetical protein n=1 Tax=Hymenobacter fodinae TaxID=2510796 RepID=UPI0010815056|nr:hypothetical protein [Hymenobacter fodinae]